ncbi:MAG TPA: transcription antitermination factor NusB [Ignavibacteriaceae bacterium]|nr:transcription antitermination factor NusB [Ignavibacteriaceae bacterium]
MSIVFKRRLVRERVLQYLYAYELNRDNLTELKSELLSVIKEQPDIMFAEDLINKTIIHIDEVDMRIVEKVNNWEMNRIALIDKILLRIGITELLFFPDIPPKVSINEVIEIAKLFSTSGSGKFINGILDSILNDEKSAGRLNKTGRGLIDENISKPSGSEK